MEDRKDKPIWEKVVLAFLLVMIGLGLTFLMYRFFPVPNQAGFDGLGALLYIFLGLGVCLVLYIGGVIFLRQYPYHIFLLCLMLFFGILVIVHSLLLDGRIS